MSHFGVFEQFLLGEGSNRKSEVTKECQQTAAMSSRCRCNCRQSAGKKRIDSSVNQLRKEDGFEYQGSLGS